MKVFRRPWAATKMTSMMVLCSSQVRRMTWSTGAPGGSRSATACSAVAVRAVTSSEARTGLWPRRSRWGLGSMLDHAAEVIDQAVTDVAGTNGSRSGSRVSKTTPEETA